MELSDKVLQVLNVLICARAKKKNKILYNVIGFEKKTSHGEKIISSLNTGQFPFNNKDKHLKVEFKKVIKQKNFFATSDLNYIKHCDIMIVSINLDIINFNKKRSSKFQKFDINFRK